jgi:hypothetical protein
MTSGGPIGFAPLLFASLGGSSVNDTGYLLGIGDGDPAHLVLRKGALVQGLPDVAPGNQGVLRRSLAAVALEEWAHLRLDVIVNLNGDVILNVFRSDLGAHAVGAPSWAAIPGMDPFVDDCARINSGSAPLVAGRLGFAFQSAEVARRAAFDHLHLERQTAP